MKLRGQRQKMRERCSNFSMAKKERLDKFLVDLGYFDNKSKASATILAGSVKIDDVVITKAGFQIDPNKNYQIVIKSMPYVSRGGFKLEKALKTFDVVVKARICFDAGASTGGFTDCLLQNGAKKVFAVDVGFGQIAWKFRSDERVKVIEKTNIRNCELSEIYSDDESIAENIPDLLVMDVSFISILKVLPNLRKLLNQDFHEMICLIKPQFEAGKDLVEKGGVVRDKNVHVDVINNVINFAEELGYAVLNLTSSPIKGPSGNIEYLVHFSTKDENVKDFSVDDVVKNAFED